MALGKFITLEGGEGSGKSTQATLLCERLIQQGIQAISTREPGGTKLAEALRQVFIDTADEHVSPLAQTLMMNAARDSHVRDVILPALQAGTWVVCDRFLDSTRVYQGYAAGLNTDIIHTLERWIIPDVQPNLTLFLDVPVDLGLERATKRRGKTAADRFERQGVDYHHKLYSGFVAMTEAEPKRCRRINGNQPPDAVAEDIWHVVSAALLGG